MERGGEVADNVMKDWRVLETKGVLMFCANKSLLRARV